MHILQWFNCFGKKKKKAKQFGESLFRSIFCVYFPVWLLKLELSLIK